MSNLKNKLKSSEVHWVSVFLSYFTLFLYGMGDNLRGPLYPEVLRDLTLSDTQGSWLWASASGSVFLGGWLAAMVIKNGGILQTLKIALILMALGQFGMGKSPHLVWALGACVLFGLSSGLLAVVQNLLILQAGPMKRIRSLQAGLHSNYALASLLAPLFLALLATKFSSWRAGYIGGGILTTLGIIGVLIFVRPQAINDHFSEKKKNDSSKDPDLVRKSRLRSYKIGALLGLYVLVEIMVSSRFALFLQREAGYNFQAASLATTLFFVGLFVGRVVIIFWHPPMSLRWQMILSLFTTSLVVFAAVFFKPWLLVFSGLTMSPFYPLAMAYMSEQIHCNLQSAMSVVMAMNGLFVVTMHIVVGGLTQSWGISQALLLGPVAAGAALALLVRDAILDSRRSVQ